MQTRVDKNLLDRMVTKEHIFARAGRRALQSQISGAGERAGPGGRTGGGRVTANLLDRIAKFTPSRHDCHSSGGASLGLHESLIWCMTSEKIYDMISGMTSGTI